jgi:4-amino-4-deoxy-L-arabinose transferase-like glycosyltransferase
MHSRNEPVYFFIPIILAGTMPWCAFLWKAVKESALKMVSLFDYAERAFLITWGGVIFLFFSISSSKLIPYIAPVFLPLAVFMGHIFRVHEDQRKVSDVITPARIMYFLPVILQSLLFIVALLLPTFLKEHGIPFYKWWPMVIVPVILSIVIIFLPDLIRKKWGRGWFMTVYVISFFLFGMLAFPASQFLAPYKSAYPIAKVIKDYVPADRELYQYGMSLYGIDFYTGRRTPVVDDIGELRSGVEKLSLEERSHYFLISDEFFRLYQEKKDIFCVTERENVEKLRKKVNFLKVLWNNDSYCILHLT